MICTVHDDIVLDCPTKEVDNVAKMCYDVFHDVSDNIERIWKIKMPLRFKGEVFVGKNLKDMQEYK